MQPTLLTLNFIYLQENNLDDHPSPLTSLKLRQSKQGFGWQSRQQATGNWQQATGNRKKPKDKSKIGKGVILR
jgi:hypothetical protein